MLLKDARDSYYYNSGKVSDLVRQLALAGIGLIFILAFGQEIADQRLPRSLLYPAIFIVVALFLDFAQYAVATATWGIYARLKEKNGVDEDQEFEAPAAINWAGLVFFWLKTGFLVLAYALLGAYIIDRLLPT